MLQNTKVSKKIKIVTLGGGTGGYVIDKGLSQYENIELTSIVNSFDSGGSTGRLRDEFGGLPTGDIRRRILAHSNNENNKILREIFSYRFESNGVLNDHSLGNIILTSAMNIWGNDKGINNILKLFNINGKVLNITHDEAELCARLDDNSLIISETKIDLRDKKDKRKIKEIFLSNKVSINPIAKKALLQADTIVICPGDLYTSILPIFLVNDIRKIMKKSKARIIYISNLFTKYVETKDYNLDKFVEIVENNINKKLDHIVYNIGLVHKEVVHEYSKVDKANLVYMSKRFLENNKKRIISEDVINKEALKNRLIRHDSYKCAEIIMKLSNPKLFI
ncbi:MAG: YvcK family protein [Cyanobium sp. MAG06]|nr:YvcK family protein [Cyanobium sp. MAG06]